MTAPETAWNLHFGLTPEEAVGDGPVTVDDLAAPPAGAPADRAWGWMGPSGPQIDPTTWPRSPLTGLPMRHALTLRLPDEYRRRGDEHPGIAYFMGEGEFASPYVPTDADDPFVADLITTVDHPGLDRRTDILDQQFALVWLTEDELAGGPTPPPSDTRRPGEHEASDEGRNAWDPHLAEHPLHDLAETVWVYLAARADDPNTGVVPGSATWVKPWDETAFAGIDLVDDHLGGTTRAGAGSGLPAGLTPFYLELATPTWDVDYGNRETHLVDLGSTAFEIC